MASLTIEVDNCTGRMTEWIAALQDLVHQELPGHQLNEHPPLGTFVTEVRQGLQNVQGNAEQLRLRLDGLQDTYEDLRASASTEGMVAQVIELRQELATRAE